MDKIEELLTRGVDKIYPTKEELEKILRSGKKLKVYQGFDPTSPELHIGHLMGLRKLKQWQNLGHNVTFLIGDFTGMVGDPTGKDKSRKVLTKEEVLNNAKTYKEQASRILRFDGENPVLIKYNSEWLSKLSAAELINLTTYLSYQQVIERDMFQKRLKSNMDIALNEFLYPFMQGYDSVAMDVDVEVGGTDQMFNMLMGRTLMHKIKRKDKYVMTTPILEDSKGKKIGKTEGNTIAFNDKPVDFYRKIMSLGDEIIVKGFEYLTDLPIHEINNIADKINNGENPIKFKKELAFEITKQLHGKQLAQESAKEFEKTVQNKEMPDTIDLFPVGNFNQTIFEITSDWAQMSNSELKRLIKDKGIEVDGEKITIIEASQKVRKGMIIKIGQRRVVKLSEK